MCLSDCAHELGPSLCDAFIVHFEVVQVVFKEVGCVGWFGGVVRCTFVVLVTRWCGGLERRFFLGDSVVQVDMVALFGLDDDIDS